MSKKSRLKDASGNFDLRSVHSVTPYAVPLKDKDGKVVGEGAVATLHFESGHSLTTASPYDEVSKQWDEVEQPELLRSKDA